MTIKTVAKVLAAAALGTACGGSHRAPPPTTNAATRGESATDAIRRWTREAADGYERFDTTIFDDRLDPDGLFIGTDPGEVWNRTSFLDFHHKWLASAAAEHQHWKLTITDLAVGEAPDHQSAWMTAAIDFDAGSGKAVPFRWSAVLIKRGGTWLMSASQTSFGVPNQEAFALATAGKLQDGAPIAEQIDPGAEALVAVFDRDLGAPRAMLADISDRPDVNLMGTDPGEHMVGGGAIKKAMQAQLDSFHEKLKRSGVRAHVVPGGQLGWVMTNVEDTVEPEPGKRVKLPIRALAVYVREGGAWKLVQSHTSHGVPNG